MTMTEEIYGIALSQTVGIGTSWYKQLYEHFGSYEAIFQSDKASLKALSLPEKSCTAILDKEALNAAEEEFKYCERHQIEVLLYNQAKYPQRLNYFDNTPPLLFYKGTANLNQLRQVSIVGTREASERGKIYTNKLVKELGAHQATIVSGLAYGIDIAAHKAALEHHLPTIGVVAHGLDKIYPSSHQSVAQKMLENGGILSEHPSKTLVKREYFPMRNRIVAALADVLIVVESAKKGGSLITADIANSYDRDVFAVPGRIDDPVSQGCNWLIKSHRAHLLESVKDIEYIMRWNPQAVQGELFANLSEQDKTIVQNIRQLGTCHIDNLLESTNLPSGELAAILLQLELEGVIKSLPGSRYMAT